MEWMAKEGEPAVLTICETSSGESVTLTGEVCQKAQKRAATEEEIRKLLCQTGDTCFVVNHCHVNLTGELFLPVGAVKTLRRQGLQVLQDKLEGRKKRNIAAGKDNIPVRAEDTTCVTSLDADKENIPTTGAKNLPVNIATVLYSYQAELALQSSQIQEIYLRTEEMSEKQLRMWITKGNQAGKKMYLMMPLIFRKAIYEQEKAKVSPSSRQESIYHMKGLAGFVIRNLESFCFLTKEAHISPDQIITDANLYVTNSQGAEFWKEQGVRGCTLPLELTAGEMETFRNSQTKEAILYGYIPLMVSAQCLCYNTEGCAGKKGKPGKILTLQDGKGRKFYVYAGCKYCYNMIYHGDPLVLEQEKKIFQDMGVTRFRYDLTLESKEQSKQILSGVFPKGQKGHFYHGMM
jgi:putative protease